MKRLHTVLVISILFSLLVVAGVQASLQDSSVLELRIRRDMGFGLGGQIQGRFSLHAEGPGDLESVRFFIDDQRIGEDETEPFSIGFSTGDYESGVHTFSATGRTSGGRELRSNRITRQFATIPNVALIVGSILVLIVGFRLASYYLTKEKGQSVQQYGFLGGAICPKCGRPFSIHWWSLRLGFTRLDRCPHCGKWGTVSRASAETLEEAVRPEKEDISPEGKPEGQADESDKIRRQLEDSRFRDD